MPEDHNIFSDYDADEPSNFTQEKSIEEIRRVLSTMSIMKKESPEQKAGIKHDQEKPPVALVPPRALEQIALAFGYGASKYGQFNYMGGLAYTRLMSAAMRHILAFLKGEDYDPEAKEKGYLLPHWACACANLMMMGEQFMLKREDTDDRYKG